MPFSDPLDPSIAEDGVYYIDYSTNADRSPGDPDFGTYYCALPENPQFDESISSSGTCTWEWSLSAKDMENNPIISHDFIGPWRSYYRLRCGNDIIMAGPITDVQSRYTDQFMTIAGQTWEVFYGRYQYPFDPRPDHVNDWVFPNSFEGNEDVASGNPTPQGLAYQAGNRDVALIAYNIIRKAVHDVDNRLNFDVSELDNPIGIRTNYQLTLGDESTMDSILSSLAGIGEGFDWWISTVGRDTHIGSPYRYGSNVSPFIYYTITKETPGLIDFMFNNEGVAATHVLGRGAGLASQTQLGSAFGSLVNQEIFHRLDASYDFGDVRNRDQLERKTRKRLALDCQPVHNITVSLDPAQIPNYWPIFRKGRAIYCTFDVGWSRVNSPFQIQSFSCKGTSDNTGSMQVDLTLKQIYDIQIGDHSFFPNL